ncbi:hypothetical protein HELRODRAFT_193985 [Helobdella robusta]|uniref:Apple domain-containing protein n=1 Tax=Helobdella robusta TaxID=6412 RepID=T1FVJ5_HELRO|nr:hypothetical protein HELRODRAFT_193985 [Helobdella robusta]ESN93604.1 hypothetical protein HELRODRAFT_193985 [Helobdella robusta]
MMNFFKRKPTFLLSLSIIISNVPDILAFTSTPRPCGYDKIAGQNTQGGLVQPYNTLEDCQNMCPQTTGTNYCQYGFDWDSTNLPNRRCWFSTNNVLAPATGIDHYFISCPLSSPLSVVPGMTTMQNLVPQECTWTPYGNTNTKGGRAIPLKDDTLENCQLYCNQHLNECMKGFDYNPSNPPNMRCFVSTDTKWYFTTGVTHFQPSSACYGQTPTPYPRRNRAGTPRFNQSLIGILLAGLLVKLLTNGM